MFPEIELRVCCKLLFCNVVVGKLQYLKNGAKKLHHTFLGPDRNSGAFSLGQGCRRSRSIREQGRGNKGGYRGEQKDDKKRPISVETVAARVG